MQNSDNTPQNNAWHHVVGVGKEEIPEAEREAMERYGDIIDLPHPEPVNRSRMSREARAAQFAPFAALTGYETVIDGAVLSVEEDYLRK